MSVIAHFKVLETKEKAVKKIVKSTGKAGRVGNILELGTFAIDEAWDLL